MQVTALTLQLVVAEVEVAEAAQVPHFWRQRSWGQTKFWFCGSEKRTRKLDWGCVYTVVVLYSRCY